MPAQEICLKCSAEFPTRKALIARGHRVGYNVFSGEGPQVECPNCWHRFPSRNLRLFGVVPDHAVRWVVVALLAACVALSFVLKHGA